MLHDFTSQGLSSFFLADERTRPQPTSVLAGCWQHANTIVPEGPQGYDRYAYGNNSPVRYNDPSGHCPWCIAVGVGAVVGAIAGYGVQVYDNYQHGITGADAFTTNISAKPIVEGALIGAGAVLAVGLIATTSPIAVPAAAAGAACADGDCGNEIQQTGPALARALGQTGEEAAAVIRNTTRIPSATSTAAFRIPDQLLPEQGILSEVKNVTHLSLTNQLRGFVTYAQENGLRFELWTRATTTFSGPLQRLLEQGVIIQRILGEE